MKFGERNKFCDPRAAETTRLVNDDRPVLFAKRVRSTLTPGYETTPGSPGWMAVRLARYASPIDEGWTTIGWLRRGYVVVTFIRNHVTFAG